MSATDDAISTQLKLLPQKWFLTIKKDDDDDEQQKKRKENRQSNSVARHENQIELNVVED